MFKGTHEEMINRCTNAMAYRLKSQGIDCGENEMKHAIKDCLIFEARSPKRTEGYEFINSLQGWEIGIDFINTLNGKYSITAINYFARESFAKKIVNRNEKHV